MKNETMNTTHHIHLQLNDGKTVIDHWSHSVATVPTIGETIGITAAGGQTPSGYQQEATVFRIEHDLASGDVTVMLEASPVSAKPIRNVVFLNEDYIPAELHRLVEEYLRSRIELPVFEWMPSTEPSPIVRLHGPGRVSPADVAKLQAGVRKIVDEASTLATC